MQVMDAGMCVRKLDASGRNANVGNGMKERRREGRSGIKVNK